MHEFNENLIFTKCEHKELAKRLWLTPGSIALNALNSIVTDRNLLKAILYLADFCHTCNLEVYHSVIFKYLLNNIHFSHEGMVFCRQLAILHFNHVITDEHAKRKEDNLPRYKMEF